MMCTGCGAPCLTGIIIVVDVTIITPVAPAHVEFYETRCLPSVERQTVPVRWLAQTDEDGRGPAAIRNALLSQVKTPFVVFLDADDWIEPTFVEATLRAWGAAGGSSARRKYVYTDWWEGVEIKRAPAKPWCESWQWHVITTLIPAEAAIDAGGFNEHLPGAEDTAFYWALVRKSGVCPVHLPEPLFHYTLAGSRSRDFIRGSHYQPTVDYIRMQFGGYMGCCGSNQDNEVKAGIINSPKPGDVLAQALWAGNRNVHGTITGRLYPRAGNGKLVYISPLDAEAAPHMWRVINPNPVGGVVTETKHGFDQIAAALFGEAAPAPFIPPAPPVITDGEIQTKRASRETLARLADRMARPVSGDDND